MPCKFRVFQCHETYLPGLCTVTFAQSYKDSLHTSPNPFVRERAYQAGVDQRRQTLYWQARRRIAQSCHVSRAVQHRNLFLLKSQDSLHTARKGVLVTRDHPPRIPHFEYRDN